MGPHSLSAAVWELPPFMSLSPLCFWIFDCKDMCGDVLSVNSTARMKSNRKTCRAFSCEYQRSTLLVLVFQNLVLYNAVKQEQCLGFPSVLCQDKKQKFVFTKTAQLQDCKSWEFRAFCSWPYWMCVSGTSFLKLRNIRGRIFKSSVQTDLNTYLLIVKWTNSTWI